MSENIITRSYRYFTTKKVNAWKIIAIYILMISLGFAGRNAYRAESLMYEISESLIFLGTMALVSLLILVSPFMFRAKPARQK